MHLVYLITNIINNKQYVGYTKFSAKTRLNHHIKSAKANSDLLLHRAMRKHGFDKFKTEVLENNISDENVENREIFWIAKLDTFVGINSNGYNMTRGGDGLIGYHHTSEVKQKISNSLLGEKNPFFGRKHSAKTIETIRQKNTGKEISQQARQKLSLIHKGRKQSLEHIEKTRQKHLGSKRTQASKTKMSDARFEFCNVIGEEKFLKSISLKKQAVLEIDVYTDTVINFYNSLNDAAEALQKPASTISYLCRTNKEFDDKSKRLERFVLSSVEKRKN